MSFVLIDEEQEVRKAEALVMSRYKLNPLALKLVTTLISSVQSNDKIDQVYSISVKQFTDLAELKGNAYYKELDKATDEIFQKPVKISLGGKDWLKANWCSSIQYRSGEGIIDFQISPKLFPYILRLKNNYLKYDLKNILSLRSDYSIRLYEFLKDEYNKNGRYGKKAEAVFDIDFLRTRFEIPKSYAYKDIRVQIIDKAQKDLLANCDIKFDWEVATKLGKKVHSIKFKIYPNAKNMKANEKLPQHLDGFMKYSEYLNKKYSTKGTYFLQANFTIEDKKAPYFFGINKNNLIYATAPAGGDSINLTKAQATIIRNISYLCSIHSELYRELIENNTDFWEFKHDTENREFYSVVIKSIQEVIKNNDVRSKPMF
jgi:plasmid replication initiation protein